MDLINKAKCGYQGAYAALFDYYYMSMYNYINCIVHNDTDAEDLTMVTFEKAFKDLNKYAPFFTFKTWLSKIARNTTLDFIKYNKNRMYSDLELSQVYYIANIENPEVLLINKENVKILKLKISKLTQKRKEIAIMRIMGMRCREVSEIKNITINSVTGQLRYIKLKLAV